jgi:radical SAM/Cys-rich protein
LNRFEKTVSGPEGEGLRACGIETIQVNLGLRCNQQCAHCHVQAGPGREECMERSTLERVLELARTMRPGQVDITGGAPEMHSDLRWFIGELHGAEVPVQVRTNLTVLLEKVQEDTPEFLREHRVRLVASMPCYLDENVNLQRGTGVFARSIEALRRLNALGYGVDPGLPLNLVHNPGGPKLPGPQGQLEEDYHRELGEKHGVRFTHLLTIANMPIGRFRDALAETGGLPQYMTLLRDAYNPATVEGLMCRNQISIGWDGTLYDCDFNLALGLAVNHGAPSHIRDFDPSQLRCRRIVTGEHCFGCTAGAGSSCGGALV